MDAKEYVNKHPRMDLLEMMEKYAKYKNNKLRIKLQKVYAAGIDGIGYVGMANYQSRENEARDKLNKVMYGKGA